MSDRARCGKPRIADGLACRHPVPCPWHGAGATAESRSELARQGGLGKLRTLSHDTPEPRFRTTEDVRRYAERTAYLVTTGQLDRHVAETALRAAGLGLQVHQLKNQERLTDALLRMEHGGAAVLLLSRLQESLADGRRRPLPGRVHALAAPQEPAS